ncbi:class I SAM-dependent methyltransferase [Candidatus Woesearchaeota archaeon]|nr:class I SAM-dependent methyltransferase [Candidatus Woesearchaeota archaeon]
MAKLRTTTWAQRNYEGLARARDEAVRLEFYNPTIVNIGPGGLVDFLFEYFPSGTKARWTLIQKLRRGALKIIEDFLRNHDLFDLRTSEPEEIARLFEKLYPKEIYVVDSQPKVMDAVRRLDESGKIGPKVNYGLVDLMNGNIPVTGEVVIAYHVIQTTSNPQRALETIAASVKQGGILSLDRDYNLAGFTRRERGLYLKD